MLQYSFLDGLRRSARGTKERATRRRREDISPFVVAHRGNMPIALVTIGQVNRENVLMVAAICATGFDADQIGLVFESFQAARHPDGSGRAGLNPMTGQEWVQADLDEAILKHDAIAKGWVTESITVAAVNRAGDVAMLNMPYAYVGSHHLSWHDDEHGTVEGGQETTGRFPTAMRAFMAAPSGSVQVPADFPLDQDERDLATGRYLTGMGNAVLLYSLESDINRRAALLKYGIQTGRF